MDWEKLRRFLRSQGIHREPTLEEQEMFIYNGEEYCGDEAELLGEDDGFKELNFDE